VSILKVDSYLSSKSVEACVDSSIGDPAAAGRPGEQNAAKCELANMITAFKETGNGTGTKFTAKTRHTFHGERPLWLFYTGHLRSINPLRQRPASAKHEKYCSHRHYSGPITTAMKPSSSMRSSYLVAR
jgi:hypothetical protein